MRGNQYAGDVVGIDVSLREGIHDDAAGVQLIVRADFLGLHFGGDGDVAVKIVGMGGAEAGDIAEGLGEAGCGERMRVDDAADVGEGSVQVQVGGRVGGGAMFSIEDFTAFDRKH